MFSKVNTVAQLDSDINFGLSNNVGQKPVKEVDYEEDDSEN